MCVSFLTSVWWSHLMDHCKTCVLMYILRMLANISILNIFSSLSTWKILYPVRLWWTFPATALVKSVKAIWLRINGSVVENDYKIKHLCCLGLQHHNTESTVNSFISAKSKCVFLRNDTSTDLFCGLKLIQSPNTEWINEIQEETSILNLCSSLYLLVSNYHNYPDSLSYLWWDIKWFHPLLWHIEGICEDSEFIFSGPLPWQVVCFLYTVDISATTLKPLTGGVSNTDHFVTINVLLGNLESWHSSGCHLTCTNHLNTSVHHVNNLLDNTS